MTPLLVEAANAMRREYLEKLEEQQSELDQLKEEIAFLKQMVLKQSERHSKD